MSASFIKLGNNNNYLLPNDVYKSRKFNDDYGSATGSARTTVVVQSDAHSTMTLTRTYQEIKRAPERIDDKNMKKPAKYNNNNNSTGTTINQQSNDDDPDDVDHLHSTSVLENKKQYHSKIEKRRRDKMNTRIIQLSNMIPLCQSIPHKLDKLTVLRMAVQYFKSIKADSLYYLSEKQSKPACLTDEQLKKLLLQLSDGFVFVVRCDNGTILHASESIKDSLNYQPSDIVGNSLYGLIHPSDVSTVKDQILPAQVGTKEKFIDVKTMMPVKTSLITESSVWRLGPGARRSFYFRMQKKIIKTNRVVTDKLYSVIHCVGYLKSVEFDACNNNSKLIRSNRLEDTGGSEQHVQSTSATVVTTTTTDNTANEQTCLIAVGRIPTGINQFESQLDRFKKEEISFMSRLSPEGKFLFVEQRAPLILGFLPQELLGTSIYEYIHADDISSITESHRAVLQTRNVIYANTYRFRTKDANFVYLESEWKSFRNPWTKHIEYFISNSTVKWSKEIDYFTEKSVNSGPPVDPLLGIIANDPITTTAVDGTNSGSTSNNNYHWPVETTSSSVPYEDFGSNYYCLDDNYWSTAIGSSSASSTNIFSNSTTANDRCNYYDQL